MDARRAIIMPPSEAIALKEKYRQSVLSGFLNSPNSSLRAMAEATPLSL